MDDENKGANGDNANGEGAPAVSPTETKPEEKKPSDGGEGNNHQDPDKDLPFHQHPRWKEREQEWSKKLEDTEKRINASWEAKLKEYGIGVPKKEEDTTIPSWFGGDLKQWKAFQADLERNVITKAEERALEKIGQQQQAHAAAVKAANEWLDTSVSELESDKALNPDGKKIDREALVDIVVKNELIDSKGRWNYRAGFQILLAKEGVKPKGNPNLEERKRIADGTLKGDRAGGSKGEDKAVTSSDDFKDPKKRPW